MHDLRWIRDNPTEFDRGLTRRGLPPRAEEILTLDRSWRAAETAAQEAQARRNRIARVIGAAKDGRGAVIGANVERGPLGEQPRLERSGEGIQAEARTAAEDARR